MRRGRRSRRYNIVPEPEHESNHNNGRYFRYNNKYAKRGRFDHNTMNHYRLRRPLTRNHLQQFQTNMSQSALAQRRRKTKRSTAPPQHVLDAINKICSNYVGILNFIKYLLIFFLNNQT